MRTALFRSGWLIAVVAGMFATTTADAQEAAGTGRTHTVKRGDTLWDLSRTYLGDPFLWPEIYRINTDIVEDPHWIFPGEVLRVPGQVAQTPPPALTDEPDVQQPEPPAPVVADAPPADRGATVFASSPLIRRSSPAERRATDPQPVTAVRPGEYYAAPWVDRRGGPAGSGRIIAAAAIQGIPSTRDPVWLDAYDRAYISPPAGVLVNEGDSYLVYTPGANLGGGQQVMIPTAIARVIAAGAGEAPTVQVIHQFEPVVVGQRVIPLERAVLPLRAQATPVELGLEARIVWIPTEAVLPSLQRYVVLNASSLDGVRLGDVFTLYRPRERADGVTLPEENIALVQIVRVTERGSTGLIVDQRHPAIRDGMHARMTSRMP